MIVIVQRGKCVEFVKNTDDKHALDAANIWVNKLGGNNNYFKSFDLPDGARWDNGDMRATLMRESK
jgi:hypothetical protein